MPWGFKQDPKSVSNEPADDDADDGRGDGRATFNERRDAQRQVEGYKEKN